MVRMVVMVVVLDETSEDLSFLCFAVIFPTSRPSRGCWYSGFGLGLRFSFLVYIKLRG